MLISETTQALQEWAERPVAQRFPYAPTLNALRRRGKHFMAAELLAALAQARRQWLASHEASPELFLGKFLDVVLDKYDGRYDYLSYTALPLLEHGRTQAGDEADPALILQVHDSALCSLIGDAIRFELRRLHGDTGYLREMPPDRELLERRIGFALRSLEPALRRLGYPGEREPEALPLTAARVVRFCANLPLAHSPFVLDVSMQPVYVAHDEHLFLRILQALDSSFISVCELLTQALRLFDGAPQRSVPFIRAAETLLDEGLRHFHTLSTMQRESFRCFREFTTGASAIQSLNYKRMESLCSRPADERLDSPAYDAVPLLQQALRQGGASLDDKLAALRRQPGAHAAAIPVVEEAMQRLGVTLTRWRHSHYGIAKKYLGDSTGTGYTEGTPYLKKVKDLQVFRSLRADAGAVGE